MMTITLDTANNSLNRTEKGRKKLLLKKDVEGRKCAQINWKLCAQIEEIIQTFENCQPNLRQ